MNGMVAAGVMLTLLGCGTAASAQDQRRGYHDPVALKHANSRQYRGEPKGNEAKRMTRCRIVGRRAQDGRVCNQPTNTVRSVRHR